MATQRVGIHFETAGIDRMIAELEKVAQPPSFVVTGLLNSTLESIFELTQKRVHVISGRLKRSGRTATNFNGKTWEGQIFYGGPEGTPAYYAIYEMSRGGARPDGTPHDFFRGLENFDERFQAAIDEHFRGLG